MARTLLVVLSAAGLAACAGQSAGVPPSSPGDVRTAPPADRRPCPADAFEPFAAAFASSAAVQSAFTAFPLRVRRVEQADPEPRTVERMARPGELPFPWLALPEVRARHGVQLDVVPGDGPVRKLKLFTPDTDHQVIYSFERRDGCWRLVEIDDQSL